MPSVRELYKKHSGNRCFILGNGPSLNRVDFSRLADEFTFGVNSIFLKTQDNGFRPSFYVVEDNLVFKDNIEAIDAYPGVTKIMPDRYADQLACKDECFVFHMDTSFYNKNNKKRYGTPQFNLSEKPMFFCGQSVTYVNMQLAFYLGFTEVYLVGMDFSYSIPKDHKQNGAHIHSHGDDPNHFHKDYFGKGKTWKDPKLGRVQRSYLRAKFEFEAAGRKIWNATEGGQLETFDRISLNDVWEASS